MVNKKKLQILEETENKRYKEKCSKYTINIDRRVDGTLLTTVTRQPRKIGRGNKNKNT